MAPFAVQFAHNFEHHEHVCLTSDLHIDSHELNCKVFHFKIDQNSIFSPINFELTQVDHFHKTIKTIEVEYVHIQLHKKLSRGPPSLLL